MNKTTPFWFNINILPECQEKINHFCEKVSNKDWSEKEYDKLEGFPLIFNYQIKLFGFPFSWSSKVHDCDKSFFPDSDFTEYTCIWPNDPMYNSFYRMVYSQSKGPYKKFEHTHLILEPDVSDTEQNKCIIEDTILFSVFDEPVLNMITGLVL